MNRPLATSPHGVQAEKVLIELSKIFPRAFTVGKAVGIRLGHDRALNYSRRLQDVGFGHAKRGSRTPPFLMENHHVLSLVVVKEHSIRRALHSLYLPPCRINQPLSSSTDAHSGKECEQSQWRRQREYFLSFDAVRRLH